MGSDTASRRALDDPRLRTVAGAVGPAAAVVAVQLVLFPMPAGAWLQGVVLGLLNALVVLGLMLVWRANRVLNLAQANIGTYPAALGAGLVILGGLSLGASALLAAEAAVVVGLAVVLVLRRRPTEAVAAGAVAFALAVGGLQLAGHGGYWGGLLAGLGTAVVVGIGVDVLVVQRFQRSPRLILTVATIGLAQLFSVAALLVPRLWGADLLVKEGRPSGYGVPFHLKWTVGEQVFRGDDLVAVVVALACLVGVGLFLRRSDVGIAIRAAADRTDRAAMLGVPVLRTETAVWVVASVLSFLGVFLQGAILGFPLNVEVGLTSLLTALAAMALGRFADLPSALTAAVAVGVLNNGVAWNNGTRPAVVYAVLAAVILVGLLAQRPRRRRIDTDAVSSWQASSEPRAVPPELARLPEVRTARLVGGLVALAVAASLPLVLKGSQVSGMATVTALALVGLSVVVLTGWAGEVTLGQMAFAGVGAAVGALATAEWHLDLTLALLVAGAAAAVAAVVVGLPALRFHGMFLAVTTLGFALATSGFLLNPTEATWIPAGDVGRRKLLGVWGLDGQGAMYLVCLGVLVLAIVGLVGLRRSRWGRALRAVRDNPRGAQAYGVRAALLRLSAFAVSGFLAGLGGCLLVYVKEAYDVATYGPDQGLGVFIASVVGGVGSLVGGILGVLVLDGAKTQLTAPWNLLPTAIGVLVVLVVLPGGLADLLSRVRDAALRRLARARGIVVPSLVADGGPTAPSDLPDAPAEPAPPVLAPAPAGDPDAARLRLAGVDVAYDGVQVLFGLDLEPVPGGITALLGTNGAGKSTALRAVGGVAPVTAGSITLDGTDLRVLRPEQVAAAGVAQMPGGQGVFPSLTVDDNLRVAGWLVRRDRTALAERIADVYARFPVLAARRGDPAADLSGGQQQQLALGMALLGRPRVLLVDELSLGLAPVVVEQLLGELRALRDEGTTIVVVEQSVNVALTVADHAYFLEKGEVRFAGPAADLLAQPDLVRSVYLHGAEAGLRRAAGDGASVGTPVTARPSAVRPEARAPAAAPALEVRGLAVAFGGVVAVDHVDLSVASGEVVGLIGPNGAGKTTLLDLVSGFTAADAGQVLVHGRPVAGRPPAARARAGLGRSFQDARLFGGLTVAETIAVALERWVQVGDPVSAAFRLPDHQVTEAAVAARMDELIDLFGLGAFRAKPIRELSTGSRRMVDLACVVAHGPSVLLLDEPSSGIAQREAEALGPLLHRVRDQLDATLVVVEHDMALISAVADRLVALDQGQVVTSGPPTEVLEHPQVVAAYLGTSDAVRHRSDHPTEPREPIS